MKLHRFIVLCAVLLAVTGLHAQSSHVSYWAMSGQWVGYNPSPGGPPTGFRNCDMPDGVMFRLQGVIPDGGTDMFFLEKSHRDFDQMYSMILTSRLTNLPVGVVTDTLKPIRCGMPTVMYMSIGP